MAQTTADLVHCVQCEDQPAAMRCVVCEEPYCGPCFQHQHRKGTRALHENEPLDQSHEPLPVAPAAAGAGAGAGAAAAPVAPAAGEPAKRPAIRRDLSTITTEGDLASVARVVPLRLNDEERALLRLLESGLRVSEYTDNVDVWSYRHKSARINKQLTHMLSVVAGLVTVTDFRAGRQISAQGLRDNAEFFQRVFEIGRRYKVMNPDKMREGYGKLLYMLQDSVSREFGYDLGVELVKPMYTASDFLTERDALGILADPDLAVATQEVLAAGRPRDEIEAEVADKAAAVERVVAAHASERFPEPEVRLVVSSIADYHSYLASNRTPVDKMLHLLTTRFSAGGATRETQLDIRAGLEGARLSHSHATQYGYVLQSLTLWREIMHDMYLLWMCAEEDLLSRSMSYRLRDTGQGLNRVQPAPRVARAMANILARTRAKVGGWIGSSAVHLGDHNVPNALMFIDKYTQVPRILAPICNVVEELERLDREDPQVHSYLDSDFGGVDAATNMILRDFFRHGFDGSGADNFFDAGSCIDGRLTSAWNWCSKISKKPYHSLFLLAGFVGFDGDFN